MLLGSAEVPGRGRDADDPLAWAAATRAAAAQRAEQQEHGGLPQQVLQLGGGGGQDVGGHGRVVVGGGGYGRGAAAAFNAAGEQEPEGGWGGWEQLPLLSDGAFPNDGGNGGGSAFDRRGGARPDPSGDPFSAAWVSCSGSTDNALPRDAGGFYGGGRLLMRGSHGQERGGLSDEGGPSRLTYSHSHPNAAASMRLRMHSEPGLPLPLPLMHHAIPDADAWARPQLPFAPTRTPALQGGAVWGARGGGAAPYALHGGPVGGGSADMVPDDDDAWR